MSNAANAQGALIRASWDGVPINRTEGKPVECLSSEAMSHGAALALAGHGTITFTANRSALATQIAKEAS